MSDTWKAGTGLGRRWTTAEEETLRAMRVAGKASDEIARALGCKEQRVVDKLKCLGLTKTGTERKCLCCGEKFISEGIHNRMCDPCKEAA